MRLHEEEVGMKVSIECSRKSRVIYVNLFGKGEDHEVHYQKCLI